MAMSDEGTNGERNSRVRGSVDDTRVSPGGTSPSVLVSATRNRKHPPLVAHVNGCPECLAWVMDYMFNVAKTMERRFR